MNSISCTGIGRCAQYPCMKFAPIGAAACSQGCEPIRVNLSSLFPSPSLGTHLLAKPQLRLAKPGKWWLCRLVWIREAGASRSIAFPSWGLGTSIKNNNLQLRLTRMGFRPWLHANAPSELTHFMHGYCAKRLVQQ